MFKKEKFQKLTKNVILYEGMVIKGYTYNNGDFHRAENFKNGWKSGWPKLRVGVIIDKYSQNYVKIQFRNSAATKIQNESKTNLIDVFNQKSRKLLETVAGTDSYCMWIRRDSIKKYYKPVTKAIFDKTTILQKHSKRKRQVEQKYFVKGKIAGLKPALIKKILHEYQFTKNELNLDPEIANLKIDILIQKHNSLKYCVPKENKKIIKANLFAKNSENYLALSNNLKNYFKNFNPDDCRSEKEDSHGKK